MKILICDVCMQEEKKVTPSKFRVGLKQRLSGVSARMDVCEKHRKSKNQRTIADIEQTTTAAYATASTLGFVTR